MSKIPIFGLILFIILLGCTNNQLENTTPKNIDLQECDSINFENIELNPDWRLKQSFDYSRYGGMGIFHNDKEFDKIFSHMINAYKEVGSKGERAKKEPVKPIINFDEYSVIWYADRISQASFSGLSNVLECEGVIVANMTLFYSDFGSSHLNLWKIKKINKKINFIENKIYEERGP
jgi:hypothetical protein|tara:strand:+ start:323 stop:853 length:531 start_codon:yes stop_codon:yes gene_type:complete